MAKTNTNWETIDMFKDRTSYIDCREHFRLKKYDVTIKEIAKVRFGSHCKYNVNYHLVWIPKTRMKMLIEPFKSSLEKEIFNVCQRNLWHPLALEIMPDHLHFFVSAHPKWAPMKLVQLIKQETSQKLRDRFSVLRDTRYSEDFWATGYYCGTAGHVSADQVARYIIEQTKNMKKNWNLFDVKPFEYDITEIAIPDKAQTKLDAFGIGGFNSALHSV
jgi:putative transposase